MQPPYDNDNSTQWTQAGGYGSLPQNGYGDLPPQGAQDASGYGAYPQDGFMPFGPDGFANAGAGAAGGMPQQNEGAQLPPPVQLPTGGPNTPPYQPGTPDAPGTQQNIPFERNSTVRQNLDPRGYTVPKTGVTGKRKPRALPAALAVIALIAVAVFIVVTLLRCSGSSAPANTAGYATVRRSSVSANYSGDALIVRNETVYYQDGISSIDYVAEEGSGVQRGEHVCTVYTSGFSKKELTTLENYRKQIKTYHKTLLASENVADQTLTGLERVILARALETRALVQGAAGNLINQETLLSSAMQERQMYLKQKYPDDQKLTRLYEDENTQMQRISSWTKQYAANTQGLVSFYTDGYETAVNMGNYLSLQPTEVRDMFSGNVPENPLLNKNSVAVYRMVKTDTWGVLMLSDDTSWTPVEGTTYKLLIESFENTVVEATVESYTKSANELLIRLRVNAPASSIESALYARTCKVHLGENVDTLTVPSQAIYEQQGQRGIVIWSQDLNGPCFVPCTILSDDGTYAYIIPSVQGVVTEGSQVYLYGQKE